MKIKFLQDLRDKIKDENEKSKVKTVKYEAVKCWEYAYLTRWVVLERGLKSLYNIYNKQRIRASALEWLEYLNGKATKAPDKIKDFSVDTQNIPRYKLIEELLGTANSIKIAIDSGEKFRPKRNAIAHKADGLKSEKTYLEYRQAIDSAITQLIKKLSEKINKNQK